MAKEKGQKEQTKIYKTLHIKIRKVFEESQRELSVPINQRRTDNTMAKIKGQTIRDKHYTEN